MARILILQENPSPFLALQNSLGSDPQLVIVSTVEKAIEILNSEWIDLIISRVHLAKDSIFDFLNRVKGDRCLRHIPFICFCGQLSKHSLLLDPLLTKVGLLSGAERYISLQEFCFEGSCDFESLKRAIEDCLRKEVQAKS